MPKHTLIGMSGARASGGGSFNRLLVVFVQAPNADRALLDVIDQCLLSGQASAIGLVHMKKFDAIEGLRGWLAWAVVLSHLTYISGFKLPGLSQPLRMIGLPAVLIFIIVSGFVITHLILEKEEPYPPYLAQRFARIYPLFLVTCLLGFFTNDLLATALSGTDFLDPQFANLVRATAASNHEYFWRHVLAHASMLHGAILNEVLPYSEYAFNMPAWSVSLEWQFYLVAPLVVFILRSRTQGLIAFAVAVGLCAFAARRWFSSTIQPGALPLATEYFAAGILSRVAYPSVEGHAWLAPAVACVLVLFPLSAELGPILIWLVVFFGLPSKNFEQPDAISRFYASALKSPLALYFGTRSYSIYLCHFPVISVIYWILSRYLPQARDMAILSLLSVPCIILASELTYRYVERPGIMMGRRISASLHRRGTRSRLGSEVLLEERRAASRDTP